MPLRIRLPSQGSVVWDRFVEQYDFCLEAIDAYEDDEWMEELVSACRRAATDIDGIVDMKRFVEIMYGGIVRALDPGSDIAVA